MILTRQQAAAVLAALRIAPVENGEAVRVSYIFPEGRIVSAMRRPGRPLHVAEVTPDTMRNEEYATLEGVTRAYCLALP